MTGGSNALPGSNFSLSTRVSDAPGPTLPQREEGARQRHNSEPAEVVYPFELWRFRLKESEASTLFLVFDLPSDCGPMGDFHD